MSQLNIFIHCNRIRLIINMAVENIASRLDIETGILGKVYAYALHQVVHAKHKVFNKLYFLQKQNWAY